MRVEGETQVLRQDATRLGGNPGAGYRLVFLDPPYAKGLGEIALATALKGGWLAPEAMVIWEESAALAVPEGFRQVDQRRYGDTVVTLLRAAE
jgi:16S rRNA (guanine966-N2)-methyltransferase